MARMWRVEYRANRAEAAALALKTIRRVQDETQPHVVCGAHGATWRVIGVEGIDPMFVTLEPVDPHDIHPCTGVGEMPRPNDAS